MPTGIHIPYDVEDPKGETLDKLFVMLVKH